MNSLSQDEELCCVVTSFSEVTDGAVICHVFGGRRQECLSSESVQLLRICDPSGTFSQLAAKAEADSRLRNAGAERIRAGLNDLIQRRLLIPVIQLLHEDDAPPLISQEPPSIVIPTAHRPDSLARAIHSITDSASFKKHDFTISIFDDSRSKKSPASVEIFPYLRKNHPHVKLRCSTAATRKLYCEHMVDLGIERDVAEFALLGVQLPGMPTVGAVRNAILLDTLGKNVLCVDDDVVFNRVRAETHTSRTLFTGHHIPWKADFFKTRDDLVADAGLTGTFDLLGAHLEIMGQSFSSLARCSEHESAGTHRLCTHMLKAILSEQPNRILVTSSGLAGDAAAPDAFRWLTTQGAWTGRFQNSDAGLEIALRSREVLVRVADVVVTHNPNIQSYCLGIANGYLMPPFLPVGRNEDGFFGMLLQCLYTGSVAHLPHAVLHAPFEKRDYAGHPDFRLADMFIALLIPMLIQARQSTLHDIEAAGRQLIQLDRPGHAELVDRLVDIRRLRVNSAIRQIELLGASAGCGALRSGLQGLKEHYRNQLTAFSLIFPQELRSRGHIEVVKSVGILVRKVGEMLANWGDLRTTALMLHQREVRMTSVL